MKKIILSIFAFALSTQAVTAQVTGRQLDTIAAPTGTTTIASSDNPSEVFLVRPVIGLFWDDRCTQVSYTLNSSVPVNAGNGPPISSEAAAQTIQTGLNRWNDNPSSYIEMNVDNITPLGNRTRIGGDFVNEIVFAVPDSFGSSFASSISTPLLADATFIAGEDFDGDGDADVYDPELVGQNVCADIDGDGDIEFPAGDYKAGTILDNDVQFTSRRPFSLEASDSIEIDLDNLSTHEFGHSHGLSHSMINQISEQDASGSTMYPFTDPSDGAVELSIRSLHVDDLAASAFLYPEGRGTTVNSSLQPGDVAFDDAFVVLRGNVSDASETPILNAAVSVLNRNGERLTQSYTGANTSLLFQNSAGRIMSFDESVTENSGDYVLPVPVGIRGTANIEALDGFPLNPNNISNAAIIAGFTSNTSFPEESSDFFESANEVRREFPRKFFSFQGRTPRPIDFVINDENILTNAVSLDFPFNSAIIGASDLIYAELFDRDTILEALENGEIFTGGTFTTFTFFGNRNSIADFNRVQLALGKVDADTGIVNIAEVIDEDNNFVAQEAEMSPYRINRPLRASIRIARGLLDDPELQLFLLIEANDIVPNRNNIPNALIGVSTTTAGTSFLSRDGEPIGPVPFGGTFDIELRSTSLEQSVIPLIIRLASKRSGRS